MRIKTVYPLLVFALLAACRSAGDEGEGGPTPAFDGIGSEETIRLTGTEPFWGGTITDETATYSTPENVEGTRFAVRRFAGLNGLGFSGKLDGMTFDLMITPGSCSDGMSDRTYPYVATLKLGQETRNGCAWTDASPFTGDANP